MKKMKVECGANVFKNKVIDVFAKKKGELNKCR